MLYQLKNGRTIDVPFEAFLEKTDEDLQELECSFGGTEISDPFCNSVIHSRQDIFSEEDLPETEPDEDHDLTEISTAEKYEEMDCPAE